LVCRPLACSVSGFSSILFSLVVLLAVGAGQFRFAGFQELFPDGVIIQDLLNWRDNQVLLTNRDMNPDSAAAAPRFDLVLDADDPVNGALLAQGLQEFTLHVAYSSAASGNLVAIIQRSGPPE
jgi:hypothetical protein